jgi:hypothetical protein
MHSFIHSSEDVGKAKEKVQHPNYAQKILRRQDVQPRAVALMDATDLPATCGGFKKNSGGTGGAGRADNQDGPESLVRRLQETHLAVVAAHSASVGDTRAAGQLDHARQCGRRRPVATQSALVSPSLELVAENRSGGHGLSVHPQRASPLKRSNIQP